MILVFLMCIALYTDCIKTFHVFKVEEFSNRVIKENVLQSFKNIDSALECGSLCLRDVQCVSVFFRSLLRTCQLHEVLFLTPEDGTEDPGTDYYRLNGGVCPWDYIHVRYLNLCYRHVLRHIKYPLALNDCSSRGEHFIVIDSQEKQDHLRKQIQASSVTLNKGSFIDGSDAEVDGVWKFHDGRPMTYFAWKPGFPKMNSSFQLDYLSVTKNSPLFLWVNVNLTFHKFYMCQVDI